MGDPSYAIALTAGIALGLGLAGLVWYLRYAHTPADHNVVAAEVMNLITSRIEQIKTLAKGGYAIALPTTELVVEWQDTSDGFEFQAEVDYQVRSILCHWLMLCPGITVYSRVDKSTIWLSYSNRSRW